MDTTYAVVWREGGELPVSGRLEVRPRGIALEGARNGQSVEREIPFDNLLTIRVGRLREERLDGQPSLVLERRRGQTIRVASVAQPGIVAELAQRLNGVQITPAHASQRALVVVPLMEGSGKRARELIEAGPPFDPKRSGLARHDIFLLEHEAVFLFEGDAGTKALEELLAEPEVWRSAGMWQEIVAGPPQLAEEAFSWVRARADGPQNGGEPRLGLGF